MHKISNVFFGLSMTHHPQTFLELHPFWQARASLSKYVQNSTRNLNSLYVAEFILQISTSTRAFFKNNFSFVNSVFLFSAVSDIGIRHVYLRLEYPHKRNWILALHNGCNILAHQYIKPYENLTFLFMIKPIVGNQVLLDFPQ